MGYLIAQFLNPRVNRREDVFGVSPENRLRFLREVLAAVRKQVEPVSPAVYMRFLFDWHEMRAGDAEGPDAVRRAIDRRSHLEAAPRHSLAS